MEFTILLGLLAGTCGILGPDDPLERFLAKHGAEAMRVEASRSTVDDVAFARMLLDEEAGTESKAYRALLREKAFRFALRHPSGHPVAVEAMELLPEVAPERRFVAGQRLEALTLEKVLPELQRSFPSCHGDEKGRIGENLLCGLLAVGDQKVFDGQFRSALELYTRARTLSGQLKDSQEPAIAARMDAVRDLERTAKAVAAIEATHLSGQATEEQALFALRFNLAFDAIGKDFTPLLAAAGSDGRLDALVAMAKEPLYLLAPEKCLSLARWFLDQAARSHGLLATGLLARAERCFQSYRLKHPQTDLAGVGAHNELENLPAAIAKLGKEWPQALILEWIRRDHLALRPDSFERVGFFAGEGNTPLDFSGRFTRKWSPDSIRGTLEPALDWLARHQDESGQWIPGGFEKRCLDDKCGGPGKDFQGIGVTGLALLAFLGDGHTLAQGRYQENVQRGVRWLLDQQQKNGFVRIPTYDHDCIYGHMIATIALCEASGLSRCEALKGPARKALTYIESARNPMKAWRYKPRNGENDTSVTGWAVTTLAIAKSLSLSQVSDDTFKFAAAWLDEMTDPNTGRVGYMTKGSPPARFEDLVHKFPAELSESLTAVGLVLRFLVGQDPKSHPIMLQHAELLAKKPPVWDPKNSKVDLYYWYWGTWAMHLMGGDYSKNWNSRLVKAICESQIQGSGCARGSWDPCGVWGADGGRVYSTAMMALCLETPYRYRLNFSAR